MTHVSAVTYLQYNKNNVKFFKNITGDELWIYSYDPKAKAPSSQLKTPYSPWSLKAWQNYNNIKTMLTIFFDWKRNWTLGICFIRTENQTMLLSSFVMSEGCRTLQKANLIEWWMEASSWQCLNPCIATCVAVSC